MQKGLALAGAEQVRPHVPQFELSLERVTQEPLQLVVPVAQLRRQVPPEQVCPALQTFVQVPQCARSAWRLTQRPLHGV